MAGFIQPTLGEVYPRQVQRAVVASELFDFEEGFLGLAQLPHFAVWFALGLLIALGAGLFGAAIVFLFLTRVLISHEENMDAADYEMVGVLGRISMPIRENGTGEIIYSQAGTRRTCGARSETNTAVEKGAEVIVTRYDKGIAYVRLWEEMNSSDNDNGNDATRATES